MILQALTVEGESVPAFTLPTVLPKAAKAPIMPPKLQRKWTEQVGREEERGGKEAVKVEGSISNRVRFVGYGERDELED